MSGKSGVFCRLGLFAAHESRGGWRVSSAQQSPDPTAGWERRSPLVALTLEEAQPLLDVAVPGRMALRVDPLTTGLVNSNYRITLDSGSPVALRLYTGDHTACAREARLLRLVAGAVPAAAMLYADPDAERYRLPWMLTTWVEGVPLPEALATLEPRDGPSLAAALGATAAAIGAFTFDAPGFFGADLSIVEPLDSPAAMTRDRLAYLLFEGRASERLGPELTGRLWSVVEAGAGELDQLNGRVSLVHADYRDSNLLVSREAGVWHVTGALDWEFAFAGPSLFDLGQLLRREATLPPDFAAHVIAAYRAAGGFAPLGWRRMTLLMDLMNLCGFADMSGTRGGMLADVASLIETTVARLEAGEPDA